MTSKPPKKPDPDSAMLALRYPFDQGLAALDTEARILFVNPLALEGGLPGDAAQTDLWQWWKHAAGALSGEGRLLPVSGPEAGESYDAALIRLPRQREEGQFLIASAWARLKPGGLLMVAAANDSGGARLEKDLHWLEGAQSASKYKSRVVWGYKDAQSPCPAAWEQEGALRKNPRTGLWTQAGLFSWDRIDPATALLLPYLPRGFGGAAADLGCGYGALSLRLLEQNPRLKSLSCVDADGRALLASAKNVEEFFPHARVDYHWLDLGHVLAKPVFGPVDLIVMNPPFHAEKALAIDTGQAFIANAAAALKKQGQLLMVANAHLPYEKLLAQSFAGVEKKFEGQGFKIFAARK